MRKAIGIAIVLVALVAGLLVWLVEREDGPVPTAEEEAATSAPAEVR